jgi:hypothetical protein
MRVLGMQVVQAKGLYNVVLKERQPRQRFVVIETLITMKGLKEAQEWARESANGMMAEGEVVYYLPYMGKGGDEG